MDLKQPRRKDTGLGPVADGSAQIHGCTVITSSRGLKVRHNTSDVPTIPPHRIFHRSDAPESSVLPPLIPTKVRMAHNSHTPGYYDISEQMSSYVPESGDGEMVMDSMLVRIEMIRVRRSTGVRIKIRRMRVLRIEEVYMYPL
ncbi:hypothetical protein M9H77_07546 [Catharanthus roseus]|uniref:Uncharacterized protein n=1 Tax=Catharanthus roseus TaxID=4058 RepID=A0ACC0BVC3_CATRO|nr:hypothetical protein M9H77_07546 [Catharanthus roseus]